MSRFLSHSLNLHLPNARFTPLTLGVNRFGLLFYCLLWCGFSLVAQSFKAGNINTLKATAFDPKTKNIYAIWQDSLRLFLAPDYQNSQLLHLKHEEEYLIFKYAPFCINSTLYFVENIGGIVLQLEGDSLRRIDNSFSHRMQSNASSFVRNDTIMRYGGYGFWTYRNFFTYFDLTTREWELVVPHGSETLPQGVVHPEITLDKDLIYVHGGFYKKLQRPSQNLSLNEIWSFNTKEARWKYLGELPEKDRTDNPAVFMGQRLLLFIGSSLAVVFNPLENTKTTYQIAHDSNRGLTYDNKTKVNPNLKSFYADGWFYLLEAKPEKSSNPNLPDLYFTLVSESDFLANPIAIEPLYTAPKSMWNTALALLSGFVILGGWVVYRQQVRTRDRILMRGKTLLFKKQSLNLDATSIEVLTLLLRSGGEVSSQGMLDLIGNPEFSEGHNIKLKNQVIDTLNLKLKTFLGIEEDLVQVVRSASDRRNKSYKLNGSKFKFQV